MEILE
jgi:hypothetical protein